MQISLVGIVVGVIVQGAIILDGNCPGVFVQGYLFGGQLSGR